MKVIIHHGMDSAYDRTARNILYDFMLRNFKAKQRAFKKFIKTYPTPESFNAFIFLTPHFLIFRATMEEAYRDALMADCENPSFVRVWRDGDTQNYMCAPETALFGDYVGEMYGNDYRLKQEVKDLAIKLIKEQLKMPDFEPKRALNGGFTTAP